MQMINTAMGIEYCGGSEEFYLEMLDEFIKGEQRAVLEGHKKDADWTEYAVTAHGVKSTALTLGAQQLSEAAKGLELAAKQGDVSYIEEHHAPFLELYADTMEEMQKLIG